MNRNSERGEGRTGCLFVLVIIAALAFLTFKIGPVYIDKVNFEDDLKTITSKAGVYSWSERMIAREISNAAEGYDFKTSKEDMEINRRTRYQEIPKIVISVKCRKPIEFPGYTYVFSFESTATGLIGRL